MSDPSGIENELKTSLNPIARWSQVPKFIKTKLKNSIHHLQWNNDGPVAYFTVLGGCVQGSKEGMDSVWQP